MQLILENIGKIKERTEIKLDGITVLAGENGSGKSTVGKALFCVFDTFYNIDEQINKERTVSIKRMLIREALSAQMRGRIRNGDLQSLIIDEYNATGSRESVLNNLRLIFSTDRDSVDIDALTDKIIKALEVPNDVVEKNLLLKRLDAEFGWNIGNVNYQSDPSYIEICIHDKNISIEMDNVDTVRISKNIDLLKNIVYIDDAYAIDLLLNNGDKYWSSSDYSHFNNLVKKISISANPENSIIDDYIMDERLSEVVRKMDDAGIGDVNWKEDLGWVYSSDKLQEDISLSNISSGIKGFILLRQLIKNGYIEEKGVLILDEPEIHLHPKWQKVYAEIIVGLQKEFNLTILISTHSTDFLGCIEYYTKKNEISDRCNYYLTKENIDRVTSTIEDVTESTDKIYAELSKTFLRVSEDLDILEG